MSRARRHAVAALLLVTGMMLASRLDVGTTGEPLPATDRAAFQPRFDITWSHGALALSGHTLSPEHADLLARSAGRTFPDHPVHTDFRPLGVAPGYWQDVTIEVLGLLGTTRSAVATISGRQVRISAIVTDARWDERLATLRAGLPDDIVLDADVLAIDDAVPAQQRCEQIAAAEEFGPIAFEESTTVFRASAYPVLDRIVALADACRSAIVTITGHSDSTGDAVFNQQLSMARAQAVTAFMARRGIAATRLVAQGAGAAHPIADNRTRYGRSLNRRIDVDFSIDYAGPP